YDLPPLYRRAGVLRRAGAIPRTGENLSVATGEARISTAAPLPLDRPPDRRMPRLHQRPYPGARLRRTRLGRKHAVADNRLKISSEPFRGHWVHFAISWGTRMFLDLL